jgi:hypothetical protein
MRTDSSASRSNIYLAIVAVFLVILASVLIGFASQKTMEQQREDYYISMVDGHNNSFDFSGHTINVGLSLPMNVTAGGEDGNGIAVNSTGSENSSLIVTEITANSPPYGHLNVFQDPNTSINARVVYFNDSSSYLETDNWAYVNYIEASYSSGELTVSQQNLESQTTGYFKYNPHYHTQAGGPGGVSLNKVLSQYYLVLNQSTRQSGQTSIGFYQLNLSGGPTGQGDFVMNFTNYSPQYFALILDGVYMNAPYISYGELNIMGFSSLTIDFISFNSTTVIPYDFVKEIEIPYTNSILPMVDAISSDINLTNSSGYLKLMSGNLSISSLGDITIQDSAYLNKTKSLEVSIYLAAPSAIGSLNGSDISVTYIYRYPDLVMPLSIVSGALIGGATSLILDIVRDRYLKRNR